MSKAKGRSAGSGKMRFPGLTGPGKDLVPLLRAAANAGWKIERRADCWMVFPPNGMRPFAVHNTLNVGSVRGVRALFRRGGLSL